MPSYAPRGPRGPRPCVSRRHAVARMAQIGGSRVENGWSKKSLISTPATDAPIAGPRGPFRGPRPASRALPGTGRGATSAIAAIRSLASRGPPRPETRRSRGDGRRRRGPRGGRPMPASLFHRVLRPHGAPPRGSTPSSTPTTRAKLARDRLGREPSDGRRGLVRPNPGLVRVPCGPPVHRPPRAPPRHAGSLRRVQWVASRG